MTFGSHQRKMIKQMRKPPCNVELTREEFIKIVTWIDANCPFYVSSQVLACLFLVACV